VGAAGEGQPTANDVLFQVSSAVEDKGRNKRCLEGSQRGSFFPSTSHGTYVDQAEAFPSQKRLNSQAKVDTRPTMSRLALCALSHRFWRETCHEMQQGANE